MNCKIYNSGKDSADNFVLVEPKERYEVSGESRRGKMLETYFRPADAAARAKEMIDELVAGQEASAIDVGSITVRKVTKD